MRIGTRFRKDKETLVYDEVSFTIRSDEEEENIYISGSNCSGDGSSTSFSLLLIHLMVPQWVGVEFADLIQVLDDQKRCL